MIGRVAFLSFLYFSIDSCRSDSIHFQQEAAKVTYINPLYMSDASVLTLRQNRNSPYLTTVNATILEKWGNNVTVIMDYDNMKLTIQNIHLEWKLCTLFKLEWSKAWFKKFSDVPLHCPIPKRTYHFINVEMPPRNFPIKIPNGDYYVKLTFVKTGTKEKILEIVMNLKYRKHSFM